MNKLAAAVAIVLATSGLAHAQMYGPGPSSAEPSYATPYAPEQNWQQPAYQWQPVPSLPSVPQVQSYIPAPSQGPTGYPCTMPGCR